jgi:hypothetical protein
MPSPLVNIKIARIATVPYAIATQIGDQVAYLRDIGMQVVIISAAGPELVRSARGKIFLHLSN